MITDLRWRLAIIVVVLAACVWAIYPPGEKIRLGLDLKGGVHLVLQVHTDDAVRLDTDTTMERLREDLERAGVTFSAIERTAVGEFEVRGIQQAQDQLFRETAAAGGTAISRRAHEGGADTGGV
jgi:preprotein translocase subunit SecD